jgi:hypothetical protein
MELKVIKPFHGKVEDKVMDKGELIHSTDVERINALVGGGYCVIVSLSETPNEPHNGDEGEREKEKTTKKSNK